MSDLLADTDAYNIYNIWKDMNNSYSDPVSAFDNYYSGGGVDTRFTDFTNGWPKTRIYYCVRLYTIDPLAFGIIDWPLLDEVDITNTQADAIANAFTDYIWELVQNE
jgi:hypothetical protein